MKLVRFIGYAIFKTVRFAGWVMGTAAIIFYCAMLAAQNTDLCSHTHSMTVIRVCMRLNPPSPGPSDPPPLPVNPPARSGPAAGGS